jgi:negative regulator of sigma E activity
VRRPVLASAALLAAVVVWLALPRSAASDDAGTAAMLDRARVATAQHEFTGTMVVRWRSDGDLREKHVTVKSVDGVLRVGKDRVVGAGARRALKTDAGWSMLWSDPAPGEVPDPTAKYRFRLTGERTVAGRPTTTVVVARRDGEGMRERLSFDVASGLLLRRDQVDGDGKLARRVAFTPLEGVQRADRAGRNDLSKIEARAANASPDELDDAPSDVRVARRIGDGFALRGMYEHTDGGTQLYYSDGLFGLSLFEEQGQLAWNELPTGGQTVELGAVDARVYRTPVGVTAVWEDEDVTFTCITDAPLGEVEAVADDLHRWHEPTVLEDIGRFVTGPFDWS